MADEKFVDLKQEVERVLADAELLYTAGEVEAALDKMAAGISSTLQDKNPIVLCIMIGAVVVTGKLLTRLNFPLQLEYIHATRYQGNTSGGDMQWLRLPREMINGRSVLIVDDILDAGITMAEIVDACHDAGAEDVYTAVLLDKLLAEPKRFDRPDFTGLTIPDRYVFGYGMDYKDYLRNCNGIFAVKEIYDE